MLAWFVLCLKAWNTKARKFFDNMSDLSEKESLAKAQRTQR